MSITFFHNPRCSKSRQALALADELGLDYELKYYLKEGITKMELHHIAALIGDDYMNLIRKKEALALVASLDLSIDEWVEFIHEYPVVLQRPLLLSSTKVMIARPPERVHDF